MRAGRAGAEYGDIKQVVMRVLRIIGLGLLAVGLACMSAHADVTAIRVVGDGAPTRITIWTDVEHPSEAFLSETGVGQQIILLMLGAGADMAVSSGKGMGGVGRWDMQAGRLVLSLDRPMMVARKLDLPPIGSATSHRIILDLETVAPVRFSRVAARDMRNLRRRAAASQIHKVQNDERHTPQQLTPPARATNRTHAGEERFVVVIDPGHGGKDPGASRHGAREKDIVLESALYLKTLLEKDKRYKVYLTRETDSFIELETRVTKARNWGADLFISLHADAAGKPSVAGASLYTISSNGEKRIDREAGKNDWRMPIEDGTSKEVTGILEDLIKRETRTHSEELAEFLLPELARAGPVLRNSHRNAGFYVLLAPDVPAVLVEMGFLTNRKDVRRLKSSSGRKKAMRAIKAGIDQYTAHRDVLMAKVE